MTMHDKSLPTQWLVEPPREIGKLLEELPQCSPSVWQQANPYGTGMVLVAILWISIFVGLH